MWRGVIIWKCGRINMDENTDPIEPEDEKTSYYPYTLATSDGKRYEITDTVCFKFMTMDIKINGAGAAIIDGDIGEQILPAECRIRVLKTNKQELLVAINDDIYHAAPLVIGVNNPNYIYTRFADAVMYCKDLGYTDIMNKGMFKEEREKNERLKRLRYTEWWRREKAKRVIV
jgi:hypothetical protein